MPTEIENKIQHNIPLDSLTSIRLGGPARLYVQCESEEEILSAMEYANANNSSTHILGSGSNTIFADKGFDGLVIDVANKGVEIDKQGNEIYISANAGELWDDLVKQCAEQGLAGFECLSGIPGSVGAAPVQNIGAYGQDVSQLITQVTVINRETLELQVFSHDECLFGYRTSRFKGVDANKYIITNVVFKAVKCDHPKIVYPDIIEQLGGESEANSLDCSAISLIKIREAVLAVRQQKSMLADDTNQNAKSCGSFFINPVVTKSKLEQLQSQESGEVPFFESNNQIKIPGAWLIEKAGFPKGFRYKGVGISTQHNLAIVNYAGTTQEVISLAQNIQKAVETKFGINLEVEPNIIPHTQ